MIRTVDTDVVLATAYARRLGAGETWIGFGTGKDFRYIPVHVIATKLSEDVCTVLPLFHALTGCDTVSAFHGKGKKSAWCAWRKYPEFTAQLDCVMSNPIHLSDKDMKCIEAFIIFMNTHQRDKHDINQARKMLFCQKGRAIENIPPTKAALIEHIRRSTYQGAICWGQCLVANQQLPCPSDWGWLKGIVWQPNWTTLPDASSTCRELLKCNCKNNCKGKCMVSKIWSQLYCSLFMWK